MPGIRTIKPDFWTDDKILQVSIPARLFFIGLWNYADDNGVLEHKPLQLKARIFPLDNVDVQTLIEELVGAGLILLYSVNGENYLQVRNFRKHQKIDRPRKSLLPLPNSDINGFQLKSSEISDNHLKSTLERERDRYREGSTGTSTAPEKTNANPKQTYRQTASAKASAVAGQAAPPGGSHTQTVQLENGKCNGDGRKASTSSRRPDSYPQDFLEFWAAYPRKVGKMEALRRWQALKKAGALPDLDTLLKALEWQREQDSWRENGGQYIPHPATWLNAGRWADEPPPKHCPPPKPKPPPPEPEGIMVPDPACPVCRGGGLARDGPCTCLRLEREVLKARTLGEERGGDSQTAITRH